MVFEDSEKVSARFRNVEDVLGSTESANYKYILIISDSMNSLSKNFMALGFVSNG